MADSQSPGRENSERFARRRVSEVGFLYFDLGEQAVAQLPLYAARCNATESANVGVAALVTAQLLKASSPERNKPSYVRFPTEHFIFRQAGFKSRS